MSKNFITDVTGIILAGGESRRMGQDKRWMKLQGISLFHRTLGTMLAVFKKIVVVVARRSQMLDELPPCVEVIEDLIPNCGSAGGLYTGLQFSPTHRAFVVACDMPFLNSDLMHHFCEIDPDADVLMAKIAGKAQPMHAVYSRRCLPILSEMLEGKKLKIQDLCTQEDLVVRIVSDKDVKQWDPDGISFMNINTPMDLEFAEKLLKSRNAKL